jgi:sugar lactone lactonase YvrE
MKAQTLELMEILIIVVGISILILLSYLLFSRSMEASSSATVEESQYVRVMKFVSNFFYSRIPEIDKTMAQLLADRILSDTEIVFYGERYGGLNVTKITYDYFGQYFDERWNLTISTEVKIKNSVLWIPNSGNGNSISKVNTKDGSEMGRYYTVPSSIYGNPSRVALDSEGNVWVGNRGTRTIVKIGLLENNQCVDKNGNGVIETSRDVDQDGVIDQKEMLPFKDDECFLFEVFLGGTSYGNFGAGGVRAVCTDKNDNVYAGLYNEKKLFYVSKDGVVLGSWDLPFPPYGCFVDDNGIVWISGVTTKKLMRFDQKTGKIDSIDIGHVVYGIAPCFKEDCLVINGWEDMKLTKLNTTTNQIIFSLDKPELYQGRGIIVDENENIYAVSSGKDLIIKYDKDGNEIARASTCGTPTGVGIDAFEKVWVTCTGDNGIRRYTKDLVPEIKNAFGTGHYVYNFFTSFNLKPITLGKSLSFGYLPTGDRIRTYVIKLPLPQPMVGGVINVLFKEW